MVLPWSPLGLARLLALILVVYLGLRILLNSRFGNVVVAVREDPQRAELLGYDVRKYQLATFVIGSALAGLSGVLYTSWGQFITPASIGLPAAAMPIVWVAFSGRGDITATLVGSFLVLWAFQKRPQRPNKTEKAIKDHSPPLPCSL